MKVVIKTIKEMLKDPDVLRNEVALQKEGGGIFLAGSSMEEELAGKTLKVEEETGIEVYPYMIKGFFVPKFTVKEVIEDDSSR